MKKVSKNLFGWADTFIITGIVLLVLAFFGWIFSADSVANEILFGVLFIFMSPIVRGLGVLVQNAEEELDQRWMVKIKTPENEDEK